MNGSPTNTPRCGGSMIQRCVCRTALRWKSSTVHTPSMARERSRFSGSTFAGPNEPMTLSNCSASRAPSTRSVRRPNLFMQGLLAFREAITGQGIFFAMVETLRSLENRGYIIRKPHPAGGRAMPAKLTPQGAEQLLSVHLAMREVEERLLQGLTPEDQMRLRKVLEHCLASLQSER